MARTNDARQAFENLFKKKRLGKHQPIALLSSTSIRNECTGPLANRLLHGFCVGRSRISLANDCGAWVTIIVTTCATSRGCNIFSALFPACGLNSVCTEPGQMTETRILCARSSSATE